MSLPGIRKSAHINVRLLQANVLFLNCLFIVPVIVPYFRDVIGLGFREFMLAEAVFSAVVILMEVPTGWLSDIWTRRQTMIAGVLVYIIGMALLYIADSFGDAVAAQALIGVSVSLFSGTRSAILYDSLLEAGRDDLYSREEGFRHGLGLYVVGISCFIGGFLYEISPTLPLLMSLVMAVPGLITCVILKEPARERMAVEKHPVADMIETARYALHGHKEIAGIILLSAALFGTTKLLLWAQQPYYIMLGLEEAWFGILTAGGFMLGGLGGQFSHFLDGIKSNRKILLGCFAVVFIACVISGVFPGYHGIALLLTGSLIWGFGWPRVQNAINKRVGSGRRATILSTASLSIHIAAIPLFAVMGSVADGYGITVGLITIAGILLSAGLLSMTLLWHRQRR